MNSARIVTRVRSLLVCPCRRCRAMRRAKPRALTAEEAIAVIQTMTASDRVEISAERS